MLERWIVKHWIALSVGCLLMAAAVRMAYAQRGYVAIGGEWAIIPIMFLIEWFIKARRREARRKQEYESVKQQLEKDGYKISNAEFSCLIEYAKRKVKIAEKDESYIPILLPDMVKEYFFRMGVNLEVMSKMMKE